MNGPDLLRFLLKHTISCLPFRDPDRPRIFKKYGHYPCYPLSAPARLARLKVYPHPPTKHS